MIKREKVFIVLIFVFLLATVCLMLTSKPIQKIDQSRLASDNNNIARLEEKYKTQVKNIFSDYEKLIANNNCTIEQITQIKNKLLNLKVPTKFKDLHINLILALTRMENWLNNKNEAEKTAGQKIIDQAKIDYGWLN